MIIAAHLYLLGMVATRFLFFEKMNGEYWRIRAIDSGAMDLWTSVFCLCCWPIVLVLMFFVTFFKILMGVKR